MKYKKPSKITARTSSVTNGFVQAILPNSIPTSAQREALFAILGVANAEVIECVYCGDRATDWDHFHPLVKGKQPTGFLSNYRNLVPACGRCNQSKGGSNWHSWMTGKARNAPKSRKIKDLTARIEQLKAFEIWADNKPLDLATLVGEDVWAAYWTKLDHIKTLMNDAQKDADIIRILLAKSLLATSSS